MLFNSLHFLIFYVVVLVVYFGMPPRWRWALLLAASYYFYMCWRPAYAALLAVLTLTCYVAGLSIAAAGTPIRRRLWLAFGVGACVGLLGAFKYMDFFLVSLQTSMGAFDVHWNAPLLHLII